MIIMMYGWLMVLSGDELVLMEINGNNGTIYICFLDGNIMVYNGNIWVNFITISLSSLEIMVNKGNHPQMTMIYSL